jgi:hypothetical protein
MKMQHIDKYLLTMKEIKLRIDVIAKNSIDTPTGMPWRSQVESTGLQFRKCFELIAFASLTANVDQYEAVYADFSRHWQAAKLMKNLKRINPDFYPKPIVEVPTKNPSVLHELKYRQGDFLSVDELVTEHGRCGALMHSANPFGVLIDYEYFAANFQTWYTRIINLLNNHEIRLVNDTGMFIVHMCEVGHDEVRAYRSEPVGPDPYSQKDHA